MIGNETNLGLFFNAETGQTLYVSLVDSTIFLYQLAKNELNEREGSDVFAMENQLLSKTAIHGKCLRYP
jgi:hypothetical protein